MEDPGNLRLLCDNHGLKPDPRWLKRGVRFYIGKFVKKAFPNLMGSQEYMWVLIKGHRRGLLWGTLNNDPVTMLVTPLFNGDECEVKLSEIIAVLGKNGEEL